MRRLTIHVLHSAKERSYKNRDEINVSKEGLGDLYETKLKGFFRLVVPIPRPVMSRSMAKVKIESISTKMKRLGGSRKEEVTSMSEVRRPNIA
jgi:hypothetical protein